VVDNMREAVVATAAATDDEFDKIRARWSVPRATLSRLLPGEDSSGGANSSAVAGDRPEGAAPARCPRPTGV
jgi:hypothetical protein